MKTIFFFNLLLLGCVISSCKTMDILFNSRQSDLLHDKQKVLNEPFANSAKWSREQAIKEIRFEPVEDNDTIWLVERINEVDKRVNTLVWGNKRETAVMYNNSNGFESSKVSYSSINAPLKLLTERFDTLQIDSKKSYIGADHVFISQISQGKVSTYYFQDITPMEHFKNQ